MKKLSFIAIAAAALALAGCQLEREIDSPQDLGNSTVVATLGQATRSFLEATEDGESTTYEVYWAAPDQILIAFAGGEPALFASTNAEPAQTASFRGTFPKGEGDLYGIYPAEDGNAVDADGIISIKFHAEQTAVAGSYDPKASPAVAVSESKDLSFMNICGLLALKVGWDDVSKITLDGAMSKTLIPGGVLSVSMDEEPVLEDWSEDLDGISLLPPSGESVFSQEETYYMAVPPCSFPGGASFIVERAEGEETIIIEGSVSVERAKVHKVPVLGNDIDTNGVDCVEMAPGFFVATCNVGAENPEDAGDYFAWAETEAKDPEGYAYWDNYKWMTSGVDDWYGVNKYTWDDGVYYGVWYEYDEGSGEVVFVGDAGDGVEHKGLVSYDYEDDAARANMGGDWRIPSDLEWDYLLSDDFTWEWTGAGYTVTSHVEGCEGNSIFLPAAKYMDRNGIYDYNCGVYWLSNSSRRYSYYAQYGYFEESYNDYLGDVYLYYGFSVRGVCGEPQIPLKDPYTISDFQSARYFHDPGRGYTIAFLESAVTSQNGNSYYTDGKWFKIDVPEEIMNMVVDMTGNLNGYAWSFYFTSDAFDGKYYYSGEFESGSLKVMLDEDAGTVDFEIDAITYDNKPIQGGYSGPIEALSSYFYMYSETPKTAPKKGPSASIQAGINAPEGSHHSRGARNDRR